MANRAAVGGSAGNLVDLDRKDTRRPPPDRGLSTFSTSGSAGVDQQPTTASVSRPVGGGRDGGGAASPSRHRQAMIGRELADAVVLQFSIVYAKLQEEQCPRNILVASS